MYKHANKFEIKEMKQIIYDQSTDIISLIVF